MRPTTDSRDGVAWQVPGLRPPACRRGSLGPSSAPRVTHGTGGGAGERVSSRLMAPPSVAPLWYGMTAAASVGRGSAPESAAGATRTPGRSPFTFIAPLGLVSPLTRTHVRLLGPCFKTGRVGHRPFARREREDGASLSCTTVAGQPGHRRFPPSPAPLERATSGYQSNRAFDVPSNGSRRPTSRGEIRPPAPAWSAGTPKSSWVASANPAPSRPEPTS